jgi:hypothetical protein
MAGLLGRARDRAPRRHPDPASLYTAPVPGAEASCAESAIRSSAGQHSDHAQPLQLVRGQRSSSRLIWRRFHFVGRGHQAAPDWSICASGCAITAPDRLLTLMRMSGRGLEERGRANVDPALRRNVLPRPGSRASRGGTFPPWPGPGGPRKLPGTSHPPVRLAGGLCCGFLAWRLVPRPAGSVNGSPDQIVTQVPGGNGDPGLPLNAWSCREKVPVTGWP